MKKLLLSILAAVMAFTCCACSLGDLPALPPLPDADDGAQAEESAQPEEITLDVILFDRSNASRIIFLGSGKDGRSYVETFEEENPGVRLRLEFVSQEKLGTLLDKRLASGEIPDIINIGDLSLIPEELLLPAEDCCAEELLGSFPSAVLAAFEAEGRVLALPDLVRAEVLYCNLDLLEEAGAAVPTTWAELEEACAAISEHFGGEVIPLGLDMTAEAAPDCFARFVWSGGGDLFGPDGGWALNSSANAEALSFAFSLTGRDLTNPNPVIETQSELQQLFAEGKLAMLPAFRELPAYVAKQGGGFRMAVAAFPASEGEAYACPAELDLLAVLRGEDASGRRAEAIRSFLSFYYAPERYAERAEREDLLPASRAAAALYAGSDGALAAWPEMLEGCRFLPSDRDDWNEFCLGVASLEQLCLIGGDVAAALDALQTELAG